MVTIFHNPRCRKSREGLSFLQENNIDFEIRDYFKNPFSKEELSSLLSKLNIEPIELIRKQEDIYKKEMKGKEFSREAMLEMMILNPKLIQRPIVAQNNKAVLALPPEKINSIL